MIDRAASPAPGRALVGRAALLSRAAEALDAGERALTLRGPPGVGKTALARALRAALRARRRPCVTVSLEGPQDRDALLARLAASVGGLGPGGDATATLDAIARALDAPGATLLLDGVDPSREVVAALLDDLLDATEHLAVVACAWRRLGHAQERVLPVPPLAPADAAAMLDLRVARLAAPTPLEPAVRDALVAHAAGLPLALEILAARAAALGGARTLETLSAQGLVDDALRRTLAAAWALLDAEAREALGALGTLRGRVDVATAEALIGGADAAGALHRLVEASLVARDDDGGGAGVLLLDAVRDHAAEAARRDGREAALRDRHAEVFARRAPADPDGPEAWRALDAARDDLLAAWSWSEGRNPARAARLAAALDPLLVTQGPVALHRRVLRASLDALPDDGAGHGALHVDLLLALGRVATIRGGARDAVGPWREALGLARRDGDAAREGRSPAYLAIAAHALGDGGALEEHLRRARSVAEETRDPGLLSLCEQAEGHARRAAGAVDDAIAAFARGAAAAEVARAPRLAGLARTNLASLHAARGDLDDARRALAAARSDLAACRDDFHRVRVDIVDARVSLADGDLDGAERALRDAHDRALAFDDLDAVMESLLSLAHVAHARGDGAGAAGRLAELETRLRLGGGAGWSGRVGSLRATLAGAPRGAGPTVRVTPDGRGLRIDGAAQDLSRRGPLRRVLVALVRARVEAPGRALRAAEVQAAGWPGERMFPESGAARVYMAVRRLRALGLEPVLRTSDEGYLLDPAADVAWSPAEG